MDAFHWPLNAFFSMLSSSVFTKYHLISPFNSIESDIIQFRQRHDDIDSLPIQPTRHRSDCQSSEKHENISALFISTSPWYLRNSECHPEYWIPDWVGPIPGYSNKLGFPKKMNFRKSEHPTGDHPNGNHPNSTQLAEKRFMLIVKSAESVRKIYSFY